MKLSIRFNKKYLLPIIIYTVLVNFGCVTQNSIAQSTENRVPAHSSIEKSSDEAKIEVYQKNFVISDTDLDTILEIAPPIIKFNFPCQGENKETIHSEDLFKLLVSNYDQIIFERYWKESLKFRYETIFVHSEIDSKSNFEKTNLFFSKSNEFINSFDSIYIKAPNGKRKISNEEAIEIMKGINLATSKIVKNLDKFTLKK
jgi:hypothetical protein